MGNDEVEVPNDVEIVNRLLNEALESPKYTAYTVETDMLDADLENEKFLNEALSEVWPKWVALDKTRAKYRAIIDGTMDGFTLTLMEQ